MVKVLQALAAAKGASKSARKRARRRAALAAATSVVRTRSAPAVAIIAAGGKKKKNRKKKNKKKNRAGRQSNGRAVHRMMRGMGAVTDGISTMRTVHNGSVIEDTFQVRREKVANIVGSTSTSLNVNLALYLNPGNTVLFPIFSQIAATYEMFRVNTLVFSYETEAYAASGTNVSAGKVILATNYDPSDSQFSTDTQMENYVNSDRGAPFGEIVHDVLQGDHALKDFPMKAYYVNSSANTAAASNDSTNAKAYDLGLFQLATQGNASSSAEIGELYVTYSFTMIRPKQQTPLGQNLLAAHIEESPNGSAAAAGSAFLGTSGGVVKAGGNIPIVCTKNTFTLPLAGRFSVSAVWLSGAVTNNPSFSLGSAITNVSLIVDDTTGPASWVQSGVASGLIGVFDVATAGTGAANTITISNLAAMSAGSADIFVSQVSSGLTVAEKKESRIDRLERLLNRLIDRNCDPEIFDSVVVREEKKDEVDKTHEMEEVHRRLSRRFWPNPALKSPTPSKSS